MRARFLFLVLAIFSITLQASKDQHDHENQDHHSSEASAVNDVTESQTHQHSDDDEHSSPKFGKGKAITAIRDGGKEFMLSHSAADALGIKSVPLVPRKMPRTFEVPNSSIFEYQDKLAVFREVNGWFQLIDIRLTMRRRQTAIIQSSQLKRSDRIVIEGIGLLGVARLEAMGQGGKGHAH